MRSGVARLKPFDPTYANTFVYRVGGGTEHMLPDE